MRKMSKKTWLKRLSKIAAKVPPSLVSFAIGLADNDTYDAIKIYDSCEGLMFAGRLHGGGVERFYLQDREIDRTPIATIWGTF